MGVGLVAIASATTAAVSATATASSSAAAVSSTTTAASSAAFATRGTFFARLRDIDAQVASLQILVVEHFDRFIGFFVGAHFNKGKPARAASEFIEHQLAFNDASGLLEQIFEVAFG